MFAVAAVGRPADIEEFAVSMAEALGYVAREVGPNFNVEILEEDPELHEPA